MSHWTSPQNEWLRGRVRLHSGETFIGPNLDVDLDDCEVYAMDAGVTVREPRDEAPPAGAGPWRKYFIPWRRVEWVAVPPPSEPS